MGFSIDLANNIRDNASEEYQNRIPVATQENFASIGIALQTYEMLKNEYFSALFNKIGKTLLESKLFKNRLAKFKSGTIVNQQDVEEIFIEIAKAEGAYDPEGKNPLGRRSGPEVKAVFHRMNRRDKYVMSVGDLDVLRVFRSEATHDSFVTRIINSVYSGANYDEWLAMKNVISEYGDGGKASGSESFGKFAHTAVIPKSSDNMETFAKDLVKAVRKLVMDMSFPSRDFNYAGVLTQTNPEDLVFLVNKNILAEVDVEVLAKAFNMGKTDIEVDIVPMDDFGMLGYDADGAITCPVYGILMDKEWFKVWDTLSHMEPQRNADGLFTNYFYHVHQILSCSPFKNAVVIHGNEV